jgi:hypothetical protein
MNNGGELDHLGVRGHALHAAGARLLRTTSAALTGGLHWAMWACALTGLAAIPAGALRRLTRRPAAGVPPRRNHGPASSASNASAVS